MVAVASVLHPFIDPQPVKHLRAPQPLYFPSEAKVPEGSLHLFLRILLLQSIKRALGKEHSVGSDQFVYWNAREPKQNLAPDVFVKLGTPSSWFRSWKTWELGGPPDLAIEIVSQDRVEDRNWPSKLARYHELGVKELVRFDPDAVVGERLRTWDRLQDDFVERLVDNDTTPCLTLRFRWAVCETDDAPVTLRLFDAQGRLLPTPDEAERATATEERAKTDRLRERLRALGIDPDE